VRHAAAYSRLAPILAIVALTASGAVRAAVPAQSQPDEWQGVAAALGREGKLENGDVYRVSFPRSDLRVRSHGVKISTALALGSWAGFKRAGAETIVMGDLVLREDEVRRVVARLQDGGINPTAIHKHLLDEKPAVWWTHIHGRGSAEQLATTIRSALELTQTPLGPPGKTKARVYLDTDELDRLIGAKGTMDANVYKFGIPREQTPTENGVELPPALGTATAINFQSLGGGRAAVNGDFVMTADEVAGVTTVLTRGGIGVVSLHNHMLDEEPRLFFMHFWATGDAARLATILRAALEQTAS
jgi:hypothetical protein